MAIVMTMDSQGLELSGWNYMAQLGYGQNGDVWGPMEVSTTTPDYDENGAHLTWDENPYDGVDSGYLGAGLLYDENLGMGWHVDGQGVNREIAQSDGIDYVDIRTVVKNQAAMLWKEAVILFYKDGVVTEQIELGSFGCDTMDAGGIEQQILRITPTNSDNDKFILGGMVRIMAPEGTYLNEDDVFSQIAIYA